jgi:hypothetical protein
MNHCLSVWARRAVPITTAIALIVGFTGIAHAHDDEDYDDVPPIHAGPHSGCHWSPDWGYHCGPHMGLHSTEHHYPYYYRGDYQYRDWGDEDDWDGDHHHHRHHKHKHHDDD